MQGPHVFSFRGEGHLLEPGIAFQQLLVRVPCLLIRHEERALGGVTADGPGTLWRDVEPRIIAERPNTEQCRHLSIQLWLEHSPIIAERTRRLIPDPRDVNISLIPCQVQRARERSS
jgi:hypothetical protein